MFGRNYSLLEHYELIKETEYQTTIHIASAERFTSLFCMQQEFYPTGPSTYLDKFDKKFLLCGKVYFKSLNDDGSVGPSETIDYIINDHISNSSHKIIVSLAGSNRMFEMQRPQYCKPNPRSKKYDTDNSLSGYQEFIDDINVSDQGLKLFDYQPIRIMISKRKINNFRILSHKCAFSISTTPTINIDIMKSS